MSNEVLSEQAIFNSIFDNTNQLLNVVGATGTIAGSLPLDLISEQGVLNSAFDNTNQALKILTT